MNSYFEQVPLLEPLSKTKQDYYSVNGEDRLYISITQLTRTG